MFTVKELIEGVVFIGILVILPFFLALLWSLL